MKKIIILLSSFCMASSVFGFDDAALQRCLKNFKQAYTRLTPYVRDISVTHSTRHIGKTTHHYHEYCFNSIEAKRRFRYYQAMDEDLARQIMFKAFGDGFIIGGALACCDQVFGAKPNKKTMFVGALATLVAILYQNNTIGEVPYYSVHSLAQYDNMFAHLSFYTAGRYLFALASAAVAYYGAHYAFKKLGEILTDFDD